MPSPKYDNEFKNIVALYQSDKSKSEISKYYCVYKETLNFNNFRNRIFLVLTQK